MGRDGEYKNRLSSEKEKLIGYEWIIYSIAVDLLECVYDIGMVRAPEIGGVVMVSEVADDSGDSVLVGHCVL